MLKNSENAPDTKLGKCVGLIRLDLQNDSESEHRTDFTEKRDDGSLQFDIQLELPCHTDSDWGA